MVRFTDTKQDHEHLVCGPEAMITVPPRHYCVVRNPVVIDDEGRPVQDDYGQFKLRFGDSEIRMVDRYPDPFPLYPGEACVGPPTELRIVKQNTCLKLRALRPFTDGDVEREAGDEWHFTGPGTYVPRVDVEEVALIDARIVRHGQALRIRARRSCHDSYNHKREAGEEWLVREAGAFLPGPDEEICGEVQAVILTDKKALHLQATRNFTDVYGVERKAGEEWLVKSSMATSHLVDVYERKIGETSLTTLSNRQYCVVVDPVIDGVQRLATRQLRKGELSFFLQPGESLENGIQDVQVLADDEALLLSAREAFVDADYVDVVDGEAQAPIDIARQPGDCWMVYGPCEYVPPVMVDVLERRQAIPLDENEGVYVRDNRTGAVSARVGTTYMLKPTESLWEKELPDEVEQLLAVQAHGQSYVVPAHFGGESWDDVGGSKRRRRRAPATGAGAGAGAGSDDAVVGRDKSRVVTFRVAHNSACQIYDYKSKSSRVVFGPDLVMLEPDEDFTVLRLSGDKPKRPNVIKNLTLMLGPDFMTDVVTVETADHARLNLTLSYNWHFDVDATDADANRIFNVRDFVGDACKAIASRVRGAVAAESFDNFHKFSAKVIRTSVFGLTPEGKVRDNLVFPANSLVITNVDVQSVEPVDERTRESLQKSVQLAIEITTDSQEAKAKHEAKREEEQAKGRLERQKLQNEAEAEAQRKELLLLRAESAAVETQGQAKAEAAALADAAKIKGEADVEQAQLRADALRIESTAHLEQLKLQHAEEVNHQRAVNELEVERARELAAIEAKKFKATVEAIGADTIAAIARAGPEMQAKLLQGLGLKGFLVTDGRNPINLFQTAQGMVAPGAGAFGGAGAGVQSGALPDNASEF